jgi:hypothetical protein
MPSIKNVGGRVRYSIERHDGGYNVKESPSKISPYESPDCLNVAFDDDGSVTTRKGSTFFNTTLVGSFPIDHGISYGNQAIVWANGSMWTTTSTSGSTFTKITQSSGKFAAGSHIAAVVYQNVLFSSDGTNGPWKYTGGESFYNMGIDIPSAPAGASGAAGNIQPGTYYYAVSFVNTQVVEGELGSSSAGVTLAATATVDLTGIPVGSTLAGVNERFVYRAVASSGPFRKIATISNNTTTTYTDTTVVGSEGKNSIFDGTKPSPFKTATLHKERIFFDDSSNKSLLRYTEFQNPFISEATSFEPINNGDGEDIIAIASQDDVVVSFKKNRSVGIITNDPSDDTTWSKQDLPANIGIIGPRAFASIQNALVFIGRQNNRLTGFHILTGLNVVETSDGRLRSLSISERIEPELFEDLAPTQLAEMAMGVYENRLYTAMTDDGTTNDKIYWLDLNRIGSEGQPGSWAPWTGINAKCFFTHNGNFLSGDSTSTGFVRKLNQTAYNDSGVAINSYFWTKQIGGEEDGSLDAYIKDLREIYVWRSLLGAYSMNVKYRTDGEAGDGTAFPVDLTPTTSIWGTSLFGTALWGGLRDDFEARLTIGRVQGRRFQIGFDNQNAINQGFRVHRTEIGMNLRRPR